LRTSPGKIDTAMLSSGTEKIIGQMLMRRLGTPDHPPVTDINGNTASPETRSC